MLHRMLNGVGPYRKTTLHYHFDLEEWPWTTAYTMTHTISQISHSRVIRVSLSVSPESYYGFWTLDNLRIWKSDQAGRLCLVCLNSYKRKVTVNGHKKDCRSVRFKIKHIWNQWIKGHQYYNQLLISPNTKNSVKSKKLYIYMYVIWCLIQHLLRNQPQRRALVLPFIIKQLFIEQP